MKVSQALRNCIPHLPRDYFICHALFRASIDAGEEAASAYSDAARLVKERINECHTADEFVALQVGWRSYYGVGSIADILKQSGIDMTQWRLNFLFELISALEAKGA